MEKIKYSSAYAEVLHYLKGIDKEYIDKIPKKLLNFFEQNVNPYYTCDFDYELPLKDLKLSEISLGLIGMIALNYWCNSEEEKNKLKEVFYQNELDYQEELREKYNPDNLFKNKQKAEVEEKKKNSMVEYKEKNFLQKIFDKIINLFKSRI